MVHHDGARFRYAFITPRVPYLTALFLCLASIFPPVETDGYNICRASGTFKYEPQRGGLHQHRAAPCARKLKPKTSPERAQACPNPIHGKTELIDIDSITSCFFGPRALVVHHDGVRLRYAFITPGVPYLTALFTVWNQSFRRINPAATISAVPPALL